MARDIDAAALAALQTNVIRPVLLVRLDIVTDPLVAWTGPGVFAPSGTPDAKLNGQIFVSVAPIMNLSNITEDRGYGGPVTITVSGHDLDEDLLQQIVNDKRKWRLQTAYLWLGLLSADQKNVIDDPIRIKTGIIASITTTRTGGDSSVHVVIDQDLGTAIDAPFRYMDHPRFYSADTFGTFMAKLVNKPIGLDASDTGHHTFTADGENLDESQFNDF